MTYGMGPDTAPGSGTTWWEYKEKHGHVPICCLKCPRYNRDCDGHPIPSTIGKDRDATQSEECKLRELEPRRRIPMDNPDED